MGSSIAETDEADTAAAQSPADAGVPAAIGRASQARSNGGSLPWTATFFSVAYTGSPLRYSG